jgi:hypothetical protein
LSSLMASSGNESYMYWSLTLGYLILQYIRFRLCK